MNADFRVGHWLVAPSLNSISRNDTTVRLEPKVMEVLVCLAEHAGETLSKEKLLQIVWPDTFVSDDVLKHCVSELRRALEDDAREPHVIQTIARRGYRLVVPVEPANGIKESSTLAGSAPRAITGLSARSWWIGATVGTAILLLVLLIAAKKIRSGGSSNVPVIHSLAVLPLQSLSADPAQEYFSDGMTDALITDLAQVSAIKVVSRTSALRYKNTREPLPQIARELNVDGIVTGTVQRSGDRVRITAQLIYGPADRHLWAKSFERDLKDMLALQSTIASEIANEIQVKLTPTEQAKLRNVRPVNPKALDAYVEARFHIDQACKLDLYYGKQELLKQELRKAVSYLDRALQEDPGYTPAYLAYFDAVQAGFTPQLEFLPKAKAALQKALQVDEPNVEAHLGFASLLKQYEYDWAGAEREYLRAIQLNPNSADAHFQYSVYLANVGRSVEHDKELNLALALNPAHDYLASVGVDRDDQTLEQTRQALEEQGPNDPVALLTMAKDYDIVGDFKESVEMRERAFTLLGWHDFVSVLKRANAKAGPKFALEELMRACEEYAKKHDDSVLLPVAFTYCSLGNKDRAFAWLDKAVERRSWMIVYLKSDNVWDPLRSDPRFKDLLRRVGLPERSP